MSDLIIRKNLYPCPIDMGNIGTTRESKGTEWSVDDGVLTIADGTASRPYVYFTTEVLTPGERYVFACMLEASDEISDEASLILIYSRDWTIVGKWTKGDGAEVACPFTVPDDGYVNIRFAPRGGTVKVSRIQLESSKTFDETMPYFHGDIMPLPERG